jgi:hypothetical protein
MHEEHKQLCKVMIQQAVTQCWGVRKVVSCQYQGELSRSHVCSKLDEGSDFLFENCGFATACKHVACHIVPVQTPAATVSSLLEPLLSCLLCYKVALTAGQCSALFIVSWTLPLCKMIECSHMLDGDGTVLLCSAWLCAAFVFD